MFYLRVLPHGISKIAIAPHLTNFVEVMSFLVVITLRVLGCCQPRTPTSEIIPHYQSNTPSIFTRKYWTQSGHSQTIGYILVLLSLTVLPRPSLVHEFFRMWARLTSSFQPRVAYSKRQLRFRACILSVVPMTSMSSLPAWWRRC